MMRMMKWWVKLSVSATFGVKGLLMRREKAVLTTESVSYVINLYTTT